MKYDPLTRAWVKLYSRSSSGYLFRFAGGTPFSKHKCQLSRQNLFTIRLSIFPYLFRNSKISKLNSFFQILFS